ncbi:MAG: nicotinamide mononucleotide transporter [Candidatus Pacearchaeota archaeon]
MNNEGMIISIISFFVAILAIIGVILNIRKNKICFIIWFFTNFTWVIIDYLRGIYGQAALFVFYTALSVYGFIKWRKEERNDTRKGSQ